MIRALGYISRHLKYRAGVVFYITIGYGNLNEVRFFVLLIYLHTQAQ